jgi:lipoate-protein ligase A
MKLNRLETVSWQDSQLLYHALPRLGREGLNLLSPATPYVCIGYFQDVEQEVDLEMCRREGIPVFRREVGGGAVYLDGEQLFYQLVIHKENPLVPAGWEAFYRRFLEPPIEAYRALGIPAQYRPVNDIIANGRKVSGNGAAEIGDYYILVGNLIVDFNYDMMTRVLKVPDEKFRDKVFRTLQENLSTIRRELGSAPPREELWDLLAAKFAKVLGPLEVETVVDEAWRAEADSLAQTFLTDDWLHCRYRGQRPAEGRKVTIRSGVQLWHQAYKAPGGLIRAGAQVQDGVLHEVALSGDFFFYPADKLPLLEQALEGVRVEQAEMAVAKFYAEHQVDSPGVTPNDLARALGGQPQAASAEVGSAPLPVSKEKEEKRMAKILIVDDDPDFILVCKMVLQAEGYEVAEAHNGWQAMEAIRTERPDLIVLDVMMSTTLEGVSVSKALESDPQTKDVPVIMASSIATTEYASEFPEERVPIDAWLSKPIQPAVLLKTVKRFLG